jgi:hypothetical protein
MWYGTNTRRGCVGQDDHSVDRRQPGESRSRPPSPPLTPGCRPATPACPRRDRGRRWSRPAASPAGRRRSPAQQVIVQLLGLPARRASTSGSFDMACIPSGSPGDPRGRGALGRAAPARALGHAAMAGAVAFGTRHQVAGGFRAVFAHRVVVGAGVALVERRPGSPIRSARCSARRQARTITSRAGDGHHLERHADVRPRGPARWRSRRPSTPSIHSRRSASSGGSAMAWARSGEALRTQFTHSGKCVPFRRASCQRDFRRRGV